MKARWKGEVIADSDRTIEFDGNQYFPPDALIAAHFKPSSTTTVCAWKGTASYHHVVVGGAENGDAAWYYPDPKQAAAEIKDHVAFWRGVEVVE